jgi:hypothetical protein
MVQSGDGRPQETGFIWNQQAGTVVNMMKDGDRQRTCTIDSIPGIVKTFMAPFIKGAIKKARTAFKCVRSSAGINTFEVNLADIHSKVLPAGGNGTVDIDVTADYLWKEFKSVSSDDDETTELQMKFSSQAGGPTQLDLAPPAAWNCKPSASSKTNDQVDVGEDYTSRMADLSPAFNMFLSIFDDASLQGDLSHLPAMTEGAVLV